METESKQEQEYRHPTAASTTAALEREIRTAVPDITDESLTAKVDALAPRVAWTIPQAEGEASRLVFRIPGENRAVPIADALASLDPEPPVKDPATLRQEHTNAFMAGRQVERQEAHAPLTDPAPGVPDHKLTTEQFIQRQRYRRSLGQRTRT